MICRDILLSNVIKRVTLYRGTLYRGFTRITKMASYKKIMKMKVVEKHCISNPVQFIFHTYFIQRSYGSCKKSPELTMRSKVRGLCGIFICILLSCCGLEILFLMLPKDFFLDSPEFLHHLVWYWVFFFSSTYQRIVKAEQVKKESKFWKIMKLSYFLTTVIICTKNVPKVNKAFQDLGHSSRIGGYWGFQKHLMRYVCETFYETSLVVLKFVHWDFHLNN